MKIAVIGASGLLGRAVFNELKIHTEWIVLGTALNRINDEYKRVDLLNKDEIEGFMDQRNLMSLLLPLLKKALKFVKKILNMP